MKKHLSYIGASIAVVSAFTACSSNDVIENMSPGHQGLGDGHITFVQKVGNRTRATQAQSAGHYEFGVYGVLGDIADLTTTNTVMKNYLVAYGKNDLYKTIYAANASTAGENASGDNTDAADGLSTWFYEGIGTGTTGGDYTWAHTPYTTPDNDQILKYWTKGKDHHFFAYMPYAKGKDAEAKVAYTNNQLELKNLHSFYTSPVEENSAKVQPTNAVVAAANANPTKYNDEMLNYNEALYAYTHMAANTTTDVPLDFKHINSKIQIAFYEVIKGYSVEIIDVRPANTVTNHGDEAKKLYAGIAFSTAKKEQANLPMSRTQPVVNDLPQYVREATATVSSMSTTPAVAMSEQAQAKDNLRFQVPETSIATTSGEATVSPTVYYAMPQTPATDGTGLTLHISYKLTPADGSSPITIYDARCYVAPEHLQWEAGKAYKYIFKITDKTNGVTNPNEDDPATTDGGTPEPWVDPTDPRVPDEPALKPIVFDGVTITDYEAATGNAEGNDHNISETSAVNAVNWLLASGYQKESTSIVATDYNVTIEATNAQLTALSVWKDLSRVLGALYQYKGTDVWVEHITFDGATYDWKAKSDDTYFAGSNWTKTGETPTASSTDTNRLLVNAFNKLTEESSFIETVVSGDTKKITSRISMNLQFKNGTVVPFTVTVVISDYPVSPTP